MPEIQFARMAPDGRFGEAGDLGVGDFFPHAQFRERVVKSAAEHNGQRRPQRRKFFQPCGGGCGARWMMHWAVTLTDAPEKFNAP